MVSSHDVYTNISYDGTEKQDNMLDTAAKSFYDSLEDAPCKEDKSCIRVKS